MVEKTKLYLFGGWKAAFLLLVAYLLFEYGSYKIGGNLGAFIYVTMHFILMPFVSLFVIVATLVYAWRERDMANKFSIIASVVVPAAIIMIAVTGSTFLMELFQIDFNK